MAATLQVVQQSPQICDAPVCPRAHRGALLHPAVRNEQIGGARAARFGVGGPIANHHRDAWPIREAGSRLDRSHGSALAAGASGGLAGVEAGVRPFGAEVKKVSVHTRGANVEACGDRLHKLPETACYKVHRPPVTV